MIRGQRSETVIAYLGKGHFRLKNSGQTCLLTLCVWWTTITGLPLTLCCPHIVCLWVCVSVCNSIFVHEGVWVNTKHCTLKQQLCLKDYFIVQLYGNGRLISSVFLKPQKQILIQLYCAFTKKADPKLLSRAALKIRLFLHPNSASLKNHLSTLFSSTYFDIGLFIALNLKPMLLFFQWIQSSS